jgi:hypothetical protein
MLMRSEGKTITQLAQDARVSGSYFTRVLRLSFLAPEILQAILRNRHPIDLSGRAARAPGYRLRIATIGQETAASHALRKRCGATLY